MHLTFLIGNLSNSGGTQRMLTLLCNALIEKYEISILVHEGGVSFFSLDKRAQIEVLKGNLLQKNIQIYKSLKKNKSKYYINMDSNSVLLNGFFLPSFTKLIVWEHYSLENNFKKWLYTISRYYLAFRVYKLLVLSEVEKKLWLKKYNVKADKLKVIYNPVSFNAIQINNVNKRQYKTILAIGNQIQFKGFDILLEAWSQIQSDWQLKIIGLPDLEKEKLSDMIKAKKISRINIFGRTSDIISEYEKTSLFILSSRMEATPLVLIESQVFGIPIISFNHISSVSEVAKDSVLYADFSDPVNSLKEKIESMINSEELYSDYRQRSISHAKKFNREMFVDAWNNLLK